MKIYIKNCIIFNATDCIFSKRLSYLLYGLESAGGTHMI